MKQRGFLKAWQPAPVKNNWSWLPKRDSFFQRALKWIFFKKKNDSKTSRLEELATLRLAKFASETWLRLTIILKVRPDTSLLASSGTLRTADSIPESRFHRFIAVQAQRDMLERFLRIGEGNGQCDVVRFQLEDLLVLFQSVVVFGNILDSSISLRNIVVSSDRDCFFLTLFRSFVKLFLHANHSLLMQNILC